MKSSTARQTSGENRYCARRTLRHALLRRRQDWDWWSLHASRANVDEVNFWRPSPTAGFWAHTPWAPFLFKLHAPRNAIARGSFFSKFVQMPVSLTCDAFREANWARSKSEVRARISKYRKTPIALGENPTIGCILLEEPFFWPQDLWIDSTPYFSRKVVSGKTFDTAAQLDGKLWSAVLERLVAIQERIPVEGRPECSNEQRVWHASSRVPQTRSRLFPNSGDGCVRPKVGND